MKRAMILVLLASTLVSCGTKEEVSKKANSTIEQGKELLMDGDYEKAKEIFDEAIKTGDKVKEATNLDEIAKKFSLLDGYIKKNDYKNAEKVLEKLKANKNLEGMEGEVKEITAKLKKSKDLFAKYQKELNSVDKLINDGKLDKGKELVDKLLKDFKNDKEFIDIIKNNNSL